MNCACHDKPMHFSKDKRYRRGGFWQCSEKRRERNAKRVKVFGSTVYVPDEQTKQFAIRLREDRKEAQRDRA